MQSFNVRNVNHAFPLEINSIKQFGVPQKSRAGDVLEFPYPVATTYSRPTERVLFDKNRMVNHFFHFMEGLWIISGANDVAFLHQFNTQMSQYSDDGVTFHGAYGFRLRHWFGFDQIELAIKKLRLDYTDRRVVLTMWNPADDLSGGKRDHPCNTHIYLKIRAGALHMTVCCRSNDILYGALGANVVHFSMLQEYLAGRIGVKVGPYTQVSDSLHVYVNVPVWSAVKDSTSYLPDDPYSSELPEGLVRPFPMFGDTINDVFHIDAWHDDLKKFMEDPFDPVDYRTEFFQYVASPIATVWQAHKCGNNGLSFVNIIEAEDWQLACRNWLTVKEA